MLSDGLHYGLQMPGWPEPYPQLCNPYLEINVFMCVGGGERVGGGGSGGGPFY